MSDFVHGRSAYSNRGCRCEVCRAAVVEYSREWRSRWHLDEDDSRHGSINGYVNYRCRCVACRAAKAAYMRERRRRAARRATEQPRVARSSHDPASLVSQGGSGRADV